jgi:hypothetical protein
MERRLMDSIVIDSIPFQVDGTALRERMRVRDNSSYARTLEKLVRDAQTIARPKALYKVCLIDELGDDYAVIDGVRFDSRVLRVNLDDAHRVFPYVATCGTELWDWANRQEDMLHRYWADEICEMGVRVAAQALDGHLAERYRAGQLSRMNPGSLGDWPIREQRALFRLLDDPEEKIGVQLLKSCLMVPSKSVSGIQFPTEDGFVNCQLCPRHDCSGRRAPYDAELYDRRYRTNTTSPN